MLLRWFAVLFSTACLLVANPVPARAQSTNGAAPSQQQPGLTFQATSRIVLTDVVVTDRNGNPVHGLKASDFQIFDDNKTQVLSSFEEHTTTPVESLPVASTAPGVYSNDFLLHLPPVLNVIVIDITNIEIPDQMYLNYELARFVNQLPPGAPIAIYWRVGHASILLQGFTSDHALLLAAIRKALPHFPPNGREFYSDFATLAQIASDVGQFPGRKNILWFTGGSTLYLREDATAYEDQPGARRIYDALESGRIAITPVDARGLTTTTGFGMFAQHTLMTEIADTTGGSAFYNSNGLDKIAAHWLDNGGSFYTLTYSPSNLRFNNKWHKVKVKLNGDRANYTLSYRRGYFADGSMGTAPQNKDSRKLLLANGDSLAIPDLRSVPIVFQARVLPAAQAPAVSAQAGFEAKPPKRGTTPYSIHYVLPASAFVTKTVDGKQQIDLGVAVFAFNDQGAAVDHLADRVTLTVNQDKLSLLPKQVIPVDQQINLRKGQTYLYFAVWDMASGRLGTLQIPLKVAAEPKVKF
jgi:VWFA-related protein